jgi:hypothetical protein
MYYDSTRLEQSPRGCGDRKDKMSTESEGAVAQNQCMTKK